MRRHRPTRLRLKVDREMTAAQNFYNKESYVHLDGRWILYGKDWEAQKRRVIVRDGYKCVRCGTTTGPLDPHHKKWRSKGRDDRMDNLETLCRKEHDKEHGVPMWTPRTVEQGAAQ